MGLLRDFVTTCNRLCGVQDLVGVNHSIDEGIEASSPASVVGVPEMDAAIDIEFPAGLRRYEVTFSYNACASESVLAASEEDARKKARTMLRSGSPIEWQRDRPDVVHVEERWPE